MIEHWYMTVTPPMSSGTCNIHVGHQHLDPENKNENIFTGRWATSKTMDDEFSRAKLATAAPELKAAAKLALEYRTVPETPERIQISDVLKNAIFLSQETPTASSHRLAGDILDWLKALPLNSRPREAILQEILESLATEFLTGERNQCGLAESRSFSYFLAAIQAQSREASAAGKSLKEKVEKTLVKFGITQ